MAARVKAICADARQKDDARRALAGTNELMRIANDIVGELKEQLAEELLTLLDGWDQTEAAAQVGLRQPDISLLRSGQLERFSVARLLRLIARQGYHIEIALKRIARPTITRESPSVSVQRYDRLGHPVADDDETE